MAQLNDKIAVVTGGNSGIGLATAKRFAAEGAKVVITGRRKDAVDAAVEEIGHGVVGIVADASKVDDTERMVEEIRKKFDRIDVLFLNAGIAPMKPIDATDEDTFDQLMSINVKGPFFAVQKALPLLRRGSTVIFNTSIANRKGMVGTSAYAATKAALRSFTRSFAAELAPQGIRVNAVSPGPIETPLFSKTGLSDKEVSQFADAVGAQVPMGRFGKPEEIANVALFLASGESSYVNGAEICADGGLAQV